jgi:hypothetical protein
MESVESLPAEPVPICLPAEATNADKTEFAQCDIFEKKGSSFRVKCRICGWQGTTGSHKLIYGHYLHQKNNCITTCVTREKLQQEHAEFYATLTAREEALHFKRK